MKILNNSEASNNIKELFFKSELTNGRELRVLGTHDMPFFVGKDIADFLGYKDTKSAITDNVDDEDKIVYEEFVKTGEGCKFSKLF